MSYNEEVVDNYTVYWNRKLGEGAYAKVYLATNNETSKVCVAKVYNENRSEPQRQSDAQQEIEILQKMNRIRSNHLIKMLHFKVGSRKTFIFLEKMHLTLADFLKQEGGILPESEVLHYMYQLINGLNDIHQASCIHRDVKPDNIFLKGKDLYLGDFNLASDSGIRKSVLGTIAYISPEIIQVRDPNSRTQAYSYSVDLWSAGVVFYEMLFGVRPFKEQMKKGDLLAQMNRQIQDYCGENLTFPMGNTVTKATKDLVRVMLDYKNCSKLNAGKILNSPCFSRFKQRIDKVAKVNLSRSTLNQSALNSSIISTSVLMTQGHNNYVKGLDNLLLMDSIDKILNNENNKNVYLVKISDDIRALIQSLRDIQSSDPARFTKLKAFYRKVDQFGIIIKNWLFHNSREIEKALGDAHLFNKVILRNKHLLQGGIEPGRWVLLIKEDPDYFEHKTDTFAKLKKEAYKDIKNEVKMYQTIFGTEGIKEVIKTNSFMENTDLAGFRDYFLNKSVEFMKELAAQIDFFRKKEDKELCQELVCLINYYRKGLEQNRIDWDRLTVKVENMPVSKKQGLNRKIVAMPSTAVGGKNNLVMILPALLIFAALIFLQMRIFS